MDLLTQLNRVIEYIEANITDDEAVAKAHEITIYSAYHFPRIFNYMTNVPLNEYIRRRRLSLAGLELQSTDEKVIDIAMKYGYGSPDSFTRAFVRQHGVTPTEARSGGVTLHTYTPITFQITIKGVQKMNCRIEKKESFTAVGIKKAFRNDAEVNLIPQFWSDTPKETYEELWAANNAEPKGYLGLCTDFDGKHTFNYWIAAASSGVEGLEKVEIPAATWVIIEQDGALMDLANRFWTEWLPSSGYIRADENIPDVEVYPERDMPKMNFKYELWFPVVKKV
ncbi:MAG: AraC family transcriptional regulator [Oscillospiraceae bacterium]|nr:AraC family transcriptional regulator [Oscillospiraceae bacterium]